MSIPNLRFIFMVLAALCFLAAAFGASLSFRRSETQSTSISFGWLGIFFAYLVYAFM